MELYRIDYELYSATASAWQADTISGHLCWALRYTEGEGALARFLDACRQGRPPILVSNGFPAGLFPRLRVPPAPLDTTATLENQRRQSMEEKEARKIDHLTLEEFNNTINGMLVRPSRKAEISQRVTLKNQINRITGTTGESGELYEFEEFRCPAVSIYARIENDFIETARTLFSFIADNGYGKRKSVGYGAISSMSFAPLEGLNPPEDANGFVSLSNFVPARADPVVGSWDTIIKYGKLGEEYALEKSAFKKPVMMLTAGSTFYDSPVKPFYGRMVPGVSYSYPQVVQYGFALPVPARLPSMAASISAGLPRKRKAAVRK